MPTKSNGTAAKAKTPLVGPDTIHHMDCVEGMKQMPAGMVDLVITDPPFGIDFKAQRSNYNRTGSRVLEGYREVGVTDYAAFTHAWMGEAHRVLADHGAMFVFSGWNNLKDILNAIDDVGFTTVNHIIWKFQFGVATRRKFVSSHYHCLYVCKNDRLRKFHPYARYGKDETGPGGEKLHYRDKEDVWTIQREYWTGDQKTPTKLPAEIIRKILAYTSDPGDLVMDPFLGSGQTAVVSKMEGRRCVGFEIVEEYFRFAERRLKEGRYRLRDEAGDPDAASWLFG